MYSHKKRKNPKNLYTPKKAAINLKIEQEQCGSTIKYAHGVAKSVDPDQTALGSTVCRGLSP